MSIIKPNVAHAMVFTKDTTFLNLVRGERDHENYGITHTIKHVFVAEKEKKLLLNTILQENDLKILRISLILNHLNFIF